MGCDSSARDGGAVNSALPTRYEVLQACRGELDSDHPLLTAARQLTRWHERQLVASTSACPESASRKPESDPASPVTGSPCGAAESRADLITRIDRWAEIHVPPVRGAAYLHTETLGSVLDRLAYLTAHAYTALAAHDEWELWFLWERLAELSCAYEDLVTELAAGRRRLPGTMT